MSGKVNGALIVRTLEFTVIRQCVWQTSITVVDPFIERCSVAFAGTVVC